MRINNFCALLAAATMIMSSSSCSSDRSLTYFQGVEYMNAPAIGNYQVKIEPSDELLITVFSKYSEAASEFNVPQVNPATSANALASSTARQQTYVVDPQGNIIFPKLGTIHVEGLTTDQLREVILKGVDKYLTDPLVKVELVNFMVDVAGEVREPGRFPVTSERFSVLDALTAAGDLTPYGFRENVLLVREENGKRVAHRLNLNDPETLSSPYFFVKQNDYIYVEPTKVRKDNADYNTNNSFKLSVISTIVSGCSVIASLIIALTVK